MKAIVIGAGLAGLNAAYRLQQAGWQVQLLEASEKVGGRVAQTTQQGYHLETGATQISAGYGEYLRLCEELGFKAAIKPASPYLGFARDQRVIAVNARSLLSVVLAPLLSFKSKLVLLKAVWDFLRIRPGIDTHDVSKHCALDTESISEYGTRYLNQEITDYLLAPVLRGNLLRDASHASKLEFFALLSNFFGKAMLAVEGGSYRLPEALAAKLVIHCRAPVDAVRRCGDRVRVSWQQDGQPIEQTVDACVIATRLPEALAIFPDYQTLAGELDQRLEYSRGLCVHLGYSRCTESRVIGVMVPPREHRQIALLWLEHNKDRASVPAGHSLFTAYFDDACGDDCFSMSDAELTAMAGAYVESLFPELAACRDAAHISRWPMAIPHTRLGVYSAMAELKNKINRNDCIQFAGDYLSMTGQESALYSGRLAADNLLERSR